MVRIGFEVRHRSLSIFKRMFMRQPLFNQVLLCFIVFMISIPVSRAAVFQDTLVTPPDVTVSCQDFEPALLADSTLLWCDASPNDPMLWNNPVFWDSAVEIHNLRPGESTNVFVIRRGGER